MGKKAQVTIFIILGLLVLVASLFFVFVKSQTMRVNPEIKVPEKFLPVTEYVDTCLEMTAREAISRAGLQGGWVYLPEDTVNGFNFLPLMPGADFGIPYWYAAGSSRYPTIQNMENGISYYVEQNLHTCLADFGELSNLFKIEADTEPEVEVIIAEKDVVVNLLYPLNVDVVGGKENLKVKDFNTKVPIRLKKLYDLARQILDKENEEMFLDEETFNLMVLSPEVPISDVKFECSRLFKPIWEVKKNLQEIISYNFGDIRVKNTRYSEFLPGDKDYANLHLTWDVGLEQPEDIAVSVGYEPSYPMHLYVSPNQGSAIMAAPMRLFYMLPTCYMQYHFVYDVQFPVKISLMDFDTNTHEAFTFNFAVPIMINRNEPKREVPLDTIDYPARYDPDFCEETSKIPMTIMAYNEFTNEDIVDVNVTARCANYECPLGTIEPNRGTYSLEAEVPDCVGAQIVAKADNYLESFEYITLQQLENSVLRLPLYPITSIEFLIAKYEVDTGFLKDFTEDDGVVSVSLTNQAENYEYFTMYPVVDPHLDLLADGNHKYLLDIALIKDNQLVGGYKANWTASWDEITNSDKIRFHVFYDESALDDDEKQMDIWLNMGEYSAVVPEPVFE